MNYIFIKKIWKGVRRKISAVLIISILLTSISPSMATYAQNTNYKFVDELEVDESLIDDDMFYMPYASLTTTEGDENNKYVFKVKRKGEELKEEKVRLTMVDMTGKYGRDYSIKVIDKAFFAENVENKRKSKSISEYISGSNYDEYNYSDAIVDGSILSEDIMTDEEKENFEFSEDDKNKIIDDANAIFDENNLGIEAERVDATNESTNDDKEESDNNLSSVIENKTEITDEPEMDSTVNGFTGSENETTYSDESTEESNEETTEETSEEITVDSSENLEGTTTTTQESSEETEETTVTIQESTENSEETTDTTQETNEDLETTIIGENNENYESVENSSESSETVATSQSESSGSNETIIENSESYVKTTTQSEISNSYIFDENATTSTVDEIVNSEISTVSEIEINDIYVKEATTSYVVYGQEEVKFIATKSSMSIIEGYEMATGLKDDRKRVLPDRNMDSVLGVNPNSLEDAAFMQDSIEAVEEELKSAYVVLEFKEGQTEKLIEVTILNNKKYTGDRQVGFNLSSEEGSLVSGMYKSLTLIICDDEEEEPTYINFTKSNYEPKDGYITIDIERSGNLSSLATCMLDTEDITAKGGRDYSKVHAQVLFGFGVNKRTLKIPIVSVFAEKNITFKLKLQEAKGALIGNKNTTICTIRKNDKNFKFAATSKTISDDETFGSSNQFVNLDNIDVSNGAIVSFEENNFGAGGDDYDMGSIILGDPLNLEKEVYSFSSKNANSDSQHYFKNNGQGMHLYLENHSFGGETATFKWGFDTTEGDGYKYGYNGIQIDWSCNRENADITIQDYLAESSSWHKLYDRNRESWDRRTNNFFLESKSLSYLWFNINRYDGMWRTSPTIDIESIKPIKRMYKIILHASDVPTLINENGQSTVNHKYANYAITSIDGAKSDHTAVGWLGKTITVKLDNSINNPFYIKTLYITNEDGNAKWEIAKNTNTDATTISFKIDDNFVYNFRDVIEQIEREGGGHNGKFYLKAELSKKAADIKIVKDKRVDVKIWNQNPKSSTADINEYMYNIGDILHFNATIKPEYKDMFECNGLNIYKVKPYSPEWITIRKPTDGSDYFPLDAEYSEIRVEPLLSQKGNMIIIRIKKDQVDAFDKTYGFIANARSVENGEYVDYYVATDSEKICGNYFEFKARCKNENNVPVWAEINKDNIKYMQHSYYYLGSEQQTDNIIYLTYENGDATEYSIVGATYYEEVPIGGKTVDKYWQAAENVGILLDDTHFAYSNQEGSFSIMPAKGKNGYYNKFKVVSNGSEKYVSTMLNKNNMTTRKYTVYYETGEQTITKNVYEVKAEDILISNTTTTHPHVTGVKTYNMAGTSFAAIYINDSVTTLEAAVEPKKADGSSYTYTYTNSNGAIVTADENVKRVEFVVVDMKDHSIKKVIEATRSNLDKTIWTAHYNFGRGHYAEYMSGDKLYVRMVTDKKIGDGKGADIGGSGDRKDVPIFNETTYQAISTTFPFIEEAERQPYIVDFKFMEDETTASSNNSLYGANGLKLSMPIIGELATLINAQGMSFRMQTDGDRIRMYYGKKLNGKGNRYDGNGKPVSDTGYAVTLDNFSESFQDMADMIKNSTESLKKIGIGIPTWTIEPIVGVYVEFMMTYDPSATVQNKFEFTGGGGYFGGVLDLRYTFYFLVYGVPCYVGGEVNIRLVAEFGIGLNPNYNISLNDPTQSFFDQLLKKSYFEFLFRATLVATAYVGVGIAGTLGVRGGFQLNMLFIYNPFIKKKYDNVRPVGFSITGGIKIWIDAALIHIPIPVYDWPYPLNLGYFEDIKSVIPKSGNIETNSNGMIITNNSLNPRPRSSEDSVFVANDTGGSTLFGGTYERESSRTLISGVYDASEPKMLKYDTDRALLVYLDDDHSRSSIDRTVLKYMTFDASTNTWSNPQNVWDGNNTADFNPDLCDCGDKILLSWVSRPNALSDDVPRKELLKNMEIYTVFFDKTTGTFGTINRMTTDSDYDYYPKATYDEESHRIHLYYLKKQNVADINTGEEMLNEVQTEVNGAQLMYMLYADPGDGLGERWLLDYYYDYEISHIEPADRDDFINTWAGQRFKNLSINIGGNTPQINNPNISDYVVSSARIFDTTDVQTTIAAIKAAVSGVTVDPASSVDTVNEQITNFRNVNAHRNKIYNILAYVVEEDGNLNTKTDTDIYVKIHAATESETKTIRLTNNGASDKMPKIVRNGDESYLFWIQNDSMIKMLSMNELIEKAIIDEHASSEMKSGNIDIMTTDKLILSDKLTNIYPFIDDNNNIYVMWQQSSDTFDGTTNGEIEFKQDLYVSGLIETVDSDGAKVRSWSNPVRFTDNGKLNDLPTAISINNKLLLVDNQYNLKSNGDSYDITNSNLEAIYYSKKSSVEVNDIDVNAISINDDGSIRYKTLVYVGNTGLYAANGFDYEGTITYDGQVLANLSGGSSEHILPGNQTVIGGHAIIASDSTTTPDIYFTLSDVQQHHLDKVKLNINIVERGIGDSGISATKDVFDTTEQFAFSVENKDSNNLYNGNLKVVQVGDEFFVEGILMNTGDIDSNGDEKIYIIDQDDWNNPIATSEYINLPLSGQMQFSIPISKNVLSNAKRGIKDLVLCVKNDKGDILSQYEIATINASMPYDFKVNGVTDQISVCVGDSLKLDTTFEPSDRYKNATIIYSVEDGNIAKTDNDNIYGVAEGTTKLRLTTKEFGGSMTIIVNVEPSGGGGGGRPGGGGGGGGGGVGPALPSDVVINTTTVDFVKGNPIVIDARTCGLAWIYDPIYSKFKLNVTVGDQVIPAMNGFFIVTSVKEVEVDGVKKNEVIDDTYFFDKDGNMVTGWVRTSDGKWYFFENAKNINEGIMALGWKKIDNIWYYFIADGSMLTDSVTPDGYRVGANGAYLADVYPTNIN